MSENWYTKVTPQPKPEKKERLKGQRLQYQRQQLHDREKGLCQGCKKYFPVTIGDAHGRQVFDKFRCGHRSHIKSRGAGGKDNLDNLMWHCFYCHMDWEDHTGKYKDR